MKGLTESLVLLLASLFCVSPCAAQHDRASAIQKQADVLIDVPQKIDTKARYLFYLHGRIVEQDRRPTHPQYGVYEYDNILDAFKQNGFVVISEQRKKDTDVEQYGKKVAGQVRRLLEAGVPAEQITVVGASQGSWMTMLASTHLANSKINYVIIAACSAEDGFLDLVNLHGNVLSIYEQSDLAHSCQKYRADATGVGEWKEIALSTGLKHGFIYRPMKEWIEPVVAWAQSRTLAEAEDEVRKIERMYRDAIMQQNVEAIGRILADDFIATSSRGEIRDKAKEIDDIKPSPDFKMEGYELDDINIRIFGETAIVTGRATLQVAYKGQSNTSVFRYTRVYVKRNGRWQAVAQQLTRMPQR